MLHQTKSKKLEIIWKKDIHSYDTGFYSIHFEL